MEWFTSDTHFHHKNIVKGVSEWKGSEGGSHSEQNTRDFKTLEEHDEMLIKTFNKYVKQDDTLFHNGDWSFGGREQIEKFRSRLICKNIYLTYGNHDQHIERNREFQDLFTSCRHYRDITVQGQRIILSHYSMRVWDKSHHGSWMLYGHSHGTLPQYDGYAREGMTKDDPGKGKLVPVQYRTMDVGVDCAFREFGEYRPYSFDEIKSKFRNRPALLVDHHNQHTN
jgi:calcineurin-like phosphoesterase family protein